MQHLNIAQSQTWLAATQFEFVGDDFKDSESLRHRPGMQRIVFNCPTNSKLRFKLASLLVEFIKGQDCFFWATIWNNFRGELTEFENFRTQEGHLLLEYPASVFSLTSAHECANLQVYVFLFLSLNGEGYIVAKDSTKVVWLADEMLEVWSDRDTDISPDFIESLKDLGIQFFE